MQLLVRGFSENLKIAERVVPAFPFWAEHSGLMHGTEAVPSSPVFGSPMPRQ